MRNACHRVLFWSDRLHARLWSCAILFWSRICFDLPREHHWRHGGICDLRADLVSAVGQLCSWNSTHERGRPKTAEGFAQCNAVLYWAISNQCASLLRDLSCACQFDLDGSCNDSRIQILAKSFWTSRVDRSLGAGHCTFGSDCSDGCRVDL